MDFKTHLLSFLSKEEVEALLNSFNNEDKHAVLLNTKKMSDEEFISLYPNVKKHPYVEHAFIYDKNEYQLGKSLYHELGCFYLQEPSAMIVSSLIDFKEDDYVLDMCAAPGGKTIQASLKLNDTGLIISNDISRPRSSITVSNLERLGLGNVIVTNNDLEKIYDKYLEKFDVIILDAPCSGSGMFRKDDKMIDDWSINKVYKFAEIQKNLITIAYKMLKPGGVLSYSTCSYSKEEDEDVIHYLLDNSDAQIKETSLKDGYINPNDPLGIRLMPSRFSGEGQYICQIVKPGTKDKTHYYRENKYNKTLIEFLNNYHVEKYGTNFFAIKNMTNLPRLNVIRLGFKVGELEKDIFYHDLHFARYLSKDDYPNIELDEKQVKDYLSGNQLNLVNNQKGFVLLTYKNKTIDFAKTDGRVIKNYYPKGLRKNIA